MEKTTTQDPMRALNQSISHPWKETQTLARLVLVAALLRFACWLIMPSLWPDSIRFLTLAQSFLTHPGQFIASSSEEPLHPILIGLVCRLLFPRMTWYSSQHFSAGWELAGFCQTLVISGVVLIGIYYLTRRIFGPYPAFWASIFFALHPEGARMAANVMSEIPYLMFVVLCLIGVLRSGWTEEPRHMALFSLLAGSSAAASFLTRKEGLILVPIVLLYLLAPSRTARSKSWLPSLAFISGVLSLLAVYALLGGRGAFFNDFTQHHGSWKFFTAPFRQLITCGLSTTSILASTNMIRSTDMVLLSLDTFFRVSGFFPALLLLVYLLFSRKIPRQQNGALLILVFLLAHVAVAELYAFSTKLFVGRYFFTAAVLTFPFAGAALAWILQKSVQTEGNDPVLIRKRRTLFVTTLVILVTILAPQALWRYVRKDRMEIAQAAVWIRNNLPENAVITTNDPRIGFYSHRQWFAIMDWELWRASEQSQVFGIDRCYLTIHRRISPDLEKDISLHDLTGKPLFLAKHQKTFPSPTRNAVYLYHLSPFPAQCSP